MKLYSYNHKLAESVWWNLFLLTLGGLLTTICIQSVAAPHDFLAGGIMGVALLTITLTSSVGVTFRFGTEVRELVRDF